MVYKNIASFTTLKSIDTSNIGTTYPPVGTIIENPVIIIVFLNNTNGDVLVSTDGVNDMLLLGASTFRVFDLTTNSPNLVNYMFAKNTAFYIKDGPIVGTTGTFNIEAIQVR